MNEELHQRLEGIAQILMAHHVAGKRLPNAVKGSERETLVREFLGRVFPSPFRFGTGAIIDGDGRTSGQIDVVAEFPFFPSFPTPGAAERLYLAESVSFCLEVKSHLTNQWDEVERTAEAILPLRRLWNGHMQLEGDGLQLVGRSTSRIPFVAIGFEGPKKIETLEGRLREIAYHAGIHCREETKLVMIVTSQWDPKKWKKHEKAFADLEAKAVIFLAAFGKLVSCDRLSKSCPLTASVSVKQIT